MFVSLPIHLIIIAIFFAFRYGSQKINEYSRSKMLPIRYTKIYIDTFAYVYYVYRSGI